MWPKKTSEPPTLDYQRPSRKPWMRRDQLAAVVALPVGLGLGMLLAEAGYGVICVGLLVGAIGPLIVCLISKSRRIWFGLAVNLLTIATTLVIGIMRGISMSYPMSLQELGIVLTILTLVVCLPGYAVAYTLSARGRTRG